MDVSAVQVWFTDLWNYSIMPYLLEAIKEGIQVIRVHIAFCFIGKKVSDAAPPYSYYFPSDVFANMDKTKKHVVLCFSEIIVLTLFQNVSDGEQHCLITTIFGPERYSCRLYRALAFSFSFLRSPKE